MKQKSKDKSLYKRKKIIRGIFCMEELEEKQESKVIEEIDKQEQPEQEQVENENQEITTTKSTQKRYFAKGILALILIGVLSIGGTIFYQVKKGHMVAKWLYTNILVKAEKEEEEESKLFVFTFNKDNRCEDTRMVVTNPKEETKQELTSGYSENYKEICNMRKKEEKIYANISICRGMKRQDVIQWAKDLEYEVIEL